MQINTLIVIPARSGSKGVADKNIKLLGDKPLLSWTATAVSEANLSDCLAILSTDSANYADVAERIGLSAPFLRPADFSTDTASAIQVAEHALDWFLHTYGYLPDWLMWLQPTSPFRSPTIIRQAWSILKSGQAEAVVGCKEIHRDLTTLFRVESGFMQPLDSDKPTQTSRQQSQPLLTPNGAMYLCKTDYLLEHKSFYPPKTVPLVTNAIQSLDIDTEEDWAIAEAYIKQGLV
ncbi:acylneuraminate cytidylyltransferase family protein [Methylomonas albis]|uniref:Acylneuraminate cytidylyltransferase family protein n=1 Tax=Methylomonas albis TaxID=1854563 RepID=A0ABR9CW42_9GAMM|nr:acylneuraminate cytidylyltransferase family protein [Methylomonas albis]MBD9355066.1 acylneuraminate cytidylyltransferase family protein [Methylomonas albis]